MKPWIVYVRVSTDEQATQGASLDAQEQACRSLLQAHGHTPIEVVSDPGASGKNLDRPAVGPLLRRIEAGEIAGVCIYAIDRLTRRSRDLHDIVDLLEKQRVELVSVRERVDTSGPMGRFVLSLMGGIAQLERETIASRVKAGMAHRKAQGGFLGRAPVGTTAVRGADNLRRLQQHPQHGAVVARVWPMLVEGRTLLDVVAYLNGSGIRTPRGGEWSKTGVAGLVNAPSVVGVLVDRETWQTARQTLAGRRRLARPLEARPVVSQRSTTAHSLAGLCWCRHCGSAMVVGGSTGRSGRSYPYLRCSGKLKRGSTYCAARDIPHGAVERAIIEGIGKKLADGGVAEACAAWLAQRRARVADEVGRAADLRAERDRLAQRLELVWEVVESGGDTGRAARARLGEVQCAIEAVDGQLVGIEAATEIMARDEAAMATLAAQLQRGVERLPGASPEDRALVLAGLVDRIDLEREHAVVALAVPGGDAGAHSCAVRYSQPYAVSTQPTVVLGLWWERLGQRLVARVT